MSTPTPLMNLQLSTINVDSGLTWEQNVNNNFLILDAHNHTPGSGSQIPPSGLNINSSLSFQNNQAINLQATTFTQQASLATLNSIFVGTDGNLYFNDGAGDPSIKITSGGTVNATTSGISSGTATASFVSSVLVVNAASNTPANIQGGSLLLGNNVAASKFLTLSPPSSMAANYTLTLPPLPSTSGSFLTIDTSGNISSVVTVDNSTLQVSSNILQVKPQGIVQGDLALRTTGSTVGAGGVAISASCGNNVSTTNTSPTQVPNLSVTITTTGRPVMISLQPDGTLNSFSYIRAFATSGGQSGALFDIYRGSTQIAEVEVGLGNLGSIANNVIPCGALHVLDIVSAGTYTYTCQFYVGGGANQAVVNNSVLIAYEI
jgi:hypothetical protein